MNDARELIHGLLVEEANRVNQRLAQMMQQGEEQYIIDALHNRIATIGEAFELLSEPKEVKSETPEYSAFSPDVITQTSEWNDSALISEMESVIQVIDKKADPKVTNGTFTSTYERRLSMVQPNKESVVDFADTIRVHLFALAGFTQQEISKYMCVPKQAIDKAFRAHTDTYPKGVPYKDLPQYGLSSARAREMRQSNTIWRRAMSVLTEGSNHASS